MSRTFCYRGGHPTCDNLHYSCNHAPDCRHNDQGPCTCCSASAACDPTMLALLLAESALISVRDALGRGLINPARHTAQIYRALDAIDNALRGRR